MSLQFEIYNILEKYPDTRDNPKELVARWSEGNGASHETTEFIKHIPWETIVRQRRKLIEIDKAKGINKIQPTNREYLKEQEEDWRKTYSNKQSKLTL